MMRLGDKVPDFSQESTSGTFNLDEFMTGHPDKQWTVLFSHPKANTPVCTTELAEMARLEPHFSMRGVRIAAISCDSIESNMNWIHDISFLAQTEVNFPIICDTDRHVCVALNMLEAPAKWPADSDDLDNGNGHATNGDVDGDGVGNGRRGDIIHHHNRDDLPATVRSVLIIGPGRVLRAILTYPITSGRNFNEIFRLIDSLQMTDASSSKVFNGSPVLMTPANWNPGEPALLHHKLTEKEADKLFPYGINRNEHIEYLRLADPGSQLRKGVRSPPIKLKSKSGTRTPGTESVASESEGPGAEIKAPQEKIEIDSHSSTSASFSSRGIASRDE